MSEIDADGVLIGDHRCSVRLNRVGAQTEVGVPTLINIQAGPFSGSIRDDTVGSYSGFLEQLKELHSKLSGIAKLGSYEGFSLTLTGDGRGTIRGDVKAFGGHAHPLIQLEFDFAIDQTYLPRIIRAINREFLAEDDHRR
jgi:hypothetical protein